MLSIEKLKQIKVEERDNKVIYYLLATIIGECEQISKNPSNAEIVGIFQKMYKDNNTTLKECSANRVNQIQELTQENDFISQYLPVQLTDDELIALIGSQISCGIQMPGIMKYLSLNYKGRYDSKRVINILKSLE